MRLVKWLLTASLLAGGVLLFFAVAGGSSEVPASFSVSPGNPSAWRGVLFRDTSRGLADAVSWHWDFGDGEFSSSSSPLHVYRFPGVYTVTLTVLTPSGSRVQKQSVEVSADNTLRLLSGRFEVVLFAQDQRTGRTAEGLAIPQSDLFGYFSIPGITNNPDNPEMFVKMLDARVVNGQFWFFYNGLTDLFVRLTVREVPTGIVKTFVKEAGSACGGFDTSGFSPTGPTTVVNLEATQFQWTFDGGGNTFQMRVGQSYELRIRDGDPPGTEPHSFTGIPALGISGTGALQPGGPAVIRNFTPTSSQVGPPRPFECGLSTCGFGHSLMTGSIQVVP